MSSGKLVHWHEGLFLQPHHLQAMQQNLSEQIVFDRVMSCTHPWGMIESSLSEDALKNMRVRFTKLRAVMPSGICVEFPGNADLPALDIREAFQAGSEALTVYLGVPLWYADRANTVDPKESESDGWRIKCIYRVLETEAPDENTGGNVKSLLVRNFNTRLLLGDGDRADLEVLPILKIRRSTGEEGGHPEVDPDFIPPCMVIAGARSLYNLLKDMANQIEASRTELVQLLTRGGFQIDTLRGVQIEQMLRLQTLGRFAARFPAMVEATDTTPYAMFLFLGELMGELSALQPDTDPFAMPAYLHDDPAPSFLALCEIIRPMLHGISSASFMKEAFLIDEDTRAWVSKLTDDDITLANDYFLGIKTRQDPVEVSKLVEDPDRFKLMPRSIVTRRVRGIALKEERHPPMEFPAETGLHYFRLQRDQNPQVWEQITKEKEIGVTWVGLTQSDYALTLYMTAPEVKK
jgi:type VI secretion system ImpJ/VasE family protein